MRRAESDLSVLLWLKSRIDIRALWCFHKHVFLFFVLFCGLFLVGGGLKS